MGNEKIKKQQQQDKEEKNNSNVPQSTPMMFPFGNQSPTMFPQNVGPMQSPLFSMNNVPQTPYYQSTNNANNAFLPDPNPNAHNVGNHHSSLSQYHSFGHTASTLPMPLSLPMSNQMMQSKEEKEPKNECSNASSPHSSSNSNSNSPSHQEKKSHSRSPTPQHAIAAMSTITAMSGLTQDRNEHILPFHSRSSSTRATVGSPTNTLRSNPPQSNKSAAAISVDSGISRLSQSASLSAVATAGGLTVNTPLPSMNGQRNGHRHGGDDDEENMISVAHAPPPLGMGRFNMTPSNNNNHYLHSQHPPHSSSNTSIDTQVGSMPPLTDPSVGSQKSTPLHQRRNGLSAPPSLAIPFA